MPDIESVTVKAMPTEMAAAAAAKARAIFMGETVAAPPAERAQFPEIGIELTDSQEFRFAAFVAALAVSHAVVRRTKTHGSGITDGESCLH
jgi:hypothetical protein